MTTLQIDPLRECKEARDGVERLRRELASFGEYFATLAQGLLDARLMFSNTAGTDFGAPHEIAANPRVPSLDFSRWPSKEEVASKLKDYYDARFEYQGTYRRLPPDEQRLFESPFSRN